MLRHGELLSLALANMRIRHGGKINGDKDVPYVEEMLVNAKFKAGNVKKLVNQQAMKAAIVSAFKSLASQSKRGDMVYVHFSGHGQQMKDVHMTRRTDWMSAGFHTMPTESHARKTKVRNTSRMTK